MSRKLEGKIAVVTGGSSGIGLATAKRFVGEGAQVVLTGRRQEELDAAVSEIGASALGIQSDMSRLEDLDRLYAAVKRRHGRIDVLFANAGTAELVPLESVTNNVQPGPVATEMNPAAGSFAEAAKAHMSLGRYEDAGEIAAVVAFLAGSEAAFVTGAGWIIDGGYTA